MKKSVKIKISGMLLLVALFWSCDFLDVSPDNTPTLEHAFATRYEAEGSLYGCFGFLPDFDDPSDNPALFGGDEMWFSEVAYGIDPRIWYIARGDQGTQAPAADYWASKNDEIKYESAGLRGGKPLFTALRDCNIFLENIHMPYDLEDVERNRWIAEVKFLKAYYHFWLLRMYGPIPIIRENLPISEKGEDAQRYREPVDDVVSYIAELIDEAVNDLPAIIEDPINEMGRPTKAVALAVKGQALTLAASPLFNGNSDYAQLMDERNIPLVPQDFKPEKWQKAADALKEAIDAAEATGHRLYDFRRNNPNYPLLSEETVLAMQVRGAATERWNEEIIWGSYRNTQSLQRSCFVPFDAVQNSSTYCWENYAPTMKVVEQFYTKNGLPIEEDKDWEGVDPMELRTSTAADKYYIRENFQTIRLHFDREARFYGSIFFDGGTLYGNGRLTTDNNMWITDFKNGYPAGGKNPPDRSTATGYVCKKWLHFMSSMAANSTTQTLYQYAFPVIRLADLYLMYAEALNEAQAAPDADVYKYVDTVRMRTGLKGIVESYQEYAIDELKNKPQTKEGMRDIIHRERLNELAFEGARFWDLRRWKLSEEFMNNRPVYGLNTMGETAQDFYQKVELYRQTFGKKDYLWPIRQSVLLNNTKQVQNTGW